MKSFYNSSLVSFEKTKTVFSIENKKRNGFISSKNQQTDYESEEDKNDVRYQN